MGVRECYPMEAKKRNAEIAALVQQSNERLINDISEWFRRSTRDVMTGCLFCNKEFITGTPVMHIQAETTNGSKYRLVLCMDCGGKLEKYGISLPFDPGNNSK